MKLIYASILLFFAHCGFSQNPFIQEKRDHVWLFGYASTAIEEGFGGYCD